ncbi:MAG: hypothetical protein COX35_02070 [Candidatus Nealsonbacteria bacterium CG23_combo_of_CG06-09_8_20_14_all_37_18]|uniref:Uncharacterized protein n=1 Tax=Candidatus Nealsonbacteria bacterium CG23_combo_of_CG06-09_8_20_14_all_37_18 TaxID=1974720 RepID=A0A2G9YYC1_9BACT|nr:MAG: hypothetical protein COX35_02070 [Candidatus Nealsonbacteria bacterium CG23_combo_of_CG06-09_8_20_14_all_37_18]
MLRSPDLYNKAIVLRRKGLSYNEILKFVPVGQGTISRWCSKIPLTEKQKERLLEKKRNTPLIRQLRKQAIQSKKEARIWVKEKISKLLNQNKDYILLISGILLYWAEGAQFGNKTSIEFTNTDPKMISLMMKFFRQVLKIPEDKLKIKIRIREGESLSTAKNYWLKVTKVKKENFTRVEVLEKNKRKNKYPLGICRITIFDVKKSRKMMFLIKEFAKNFAPVAQGIRAGHS